MGRTDVRHEVAAESPLSIVLAGRLREQREALVHRWLERIAARVNIDPNDVFPTDALLDHVPLLIDGIAEYLEHPEHEIGTDAPVVAKAMELGQLRHAQGFDVYEILKEYELLGGVLFSFLGDAADAVPEGGAKGELLGLGHRVFRAIAIIQQAATMHFLRLADERVKEREDRLRAFNRTVSHEIKNRIGAVLGASEVLRELGEAPMPQREQFLGIIANNARAMRRTIENLVALSRMETTTDAQQHRHVRLPEAAQEATRSVRDAAQGALVDVRIAPDLPDVEVNAAAVELCLTNYVSNAIKYADRAKPQRWAEITAAIEGTAGTEGCKLVVRVRDNGLGVPIAKRDRLFERFFRAHETITGVEGTGLGLSIVRETVEALGGRAWAEFLEPQDAGSVFAFALPCRHRAGEGEGAATS
jgi:signal transduction histidine kinase